MTLFFLLLCNYFYEHLEIYFSRILWSVSGCVQEQLFIVMKSNIFKSFSLPYFASKRLIIILILPTKNNKLSILFLNYSNTNLHIFIFQTLQSSFSPTTTINLNPCFINDEKAKLWEKLSMFWEMLWEILCFNLIKKSTNIFFLS